MFLLRARESAAHEHEHAELRGAFERPAAKLAALGRHITPLDAQALGLAWLQQIPGDAHQAAVFYASQRQSGFVVLHHLNPMQSSVAQLERTHFQWFAGPLGIRASARVPAGRTPNRRSILNRQRRNAVGDRVDGVTPTFPHGSLLGELVLRSHADHQATRRENHAQTDDDGVPGAAPQFKLLTST